MNEQQQSQQPQKRSLINDALRWLARNHLPYTLCLVLLLLPLVLFTKGLTLPEINRSIGWSAIAIISAVMLLGPLSRLYPKMFMKYLYIRKPAGIIGALIALVHVVYSIQEFYGGDLLTLVSYIPIRIAVVFCLISTIILILMTLTSTQAAVNAMGYDKWKLLQTLGYLGLIAAAAHAFFLNYMAGFADTRPLEWVLMSVAVVVVIARMYDYYRTKSRASAQQKQNNQ